jgi:hypothetical protein
MRRDSAWRFFTMTPQGDPSKVERFEAISQRLNSFFSTPIFFILLGCLFLIAAGKLIDSTHPSFVFLLSILGVAIVLYGTGTQASGDGHIKNVPVNVVIAGGAGVLAAVFGFGVVWQRDGIQKVFSKISNFGVVELKSTSPYDFTKLHITSSTREGHPLPVIIQSNLVTVFVPITVAASHARLCVAVANAENKSMTSPDPCLNVTWKVSSEHGYGDPISRIAEAPLPLVPPRNERTPAEWQ